ncbi:MAG TPA: AlpA family phage regulatory protein [Zeimonas sp.]
MTRIIRDLLTANKLGYKSRATPWRKAKSDPDFPQPVKISEGLTGWIEQEIDDYLAAKIAKARGEKIDQHNEPRIAKARGEKLDRHIELKIAEARGAHRAGGSRDA